MIPADFRDRMQGSLGSEIWGGIAPTLSVLYANFARYIDPVALGTVILGAAGGGVPGILAALIANVGTIFKGQLVQMVVRVILQAIMAHASATTTSHAHTFAAMAGPMPPPGGWSPEQLVGMAQDQAAA